MLRAETKSRARALQLLYAWEMQGAPPVPGVASGLSRLTGPEPRILDRAEELAQGVIADVGAIDAEAARASENWRMSRIAVVERNILRLGILELRLGQVPPKVAIDEAVRLAHWFGRCPGAGVRQRRPRRDRADARPAVNALVVNWQDRENPQSGGAEIHLFEIFSRLAARGHRVRLVCSGWPGAAPRTTARWDRGRAHRHPPQLRAAGPWRRAPGAPRGAGRRGRRGHQQAAALSRRE